MVPNGYDFSGWATKANIKCSDGRTIMQDAFKECDGTVVPLVWNHDHDSVDNVLGHCMLFNEPKGVRAYGYFNDSYEGEAAKKRVLNGDVKNLSIYANKLKQSKDGSVFHGAIREVSLVLAGANPGAVIDFVIAHSDDDEDEAIIYTDEEISLEHADKEEPPKEEKKEEKPMAEETKEKTVQDVFDSLTDEQKNVVYALIGMALEEKGSDEGEKEMKHNVFDSETTKAYMASARKEFEQAVFEDAPKMGSLREAYLAHSEAFSDYLAHSLDTTGMETSATANIHREDSDGAYGIDGIDMLFPEAKGANGEPEFIRRKDEWVSKVMSGVGHNPFSRVKSMFADITEDAARAKGYITTHRKKNEVFTLLKRKTEPTTVYKKQKLDRDDILDITDFSVVAMMKKEMRWMLDEELASAYLFGDGRDSSDNDHIDDTKIRPIAFEPGLFNIKIQTAIDTADLGVDDVKSETAAKTFIKAVIRSRKKYRGSGNPTLFIGEDLLTEMLLLEDGNEHPKYNSISDLASTLRVKEIVPVPIMDERVIKDSTNHRLLAVIVNLSDYKVGTDRGGEVNFFDDFDIDYNQYTYLIESRCSGALVKPFSAISVFGAVVADDTEAGDGDQS